MNWAGNAPAHFTILGEFFERGSIMSAKKLITVVSFLLIPVLGYNQTIVPGGDVYGVWDASGSPYLVQGEITIPDDSLLSIHHGVEVIFQGHYKFIINGILYAEGTLQDSIVFTAVNPTTGWHGLRFSYADGICLLSYCRIEYGYASGTGDDDYGGGIYSVYSDIVASDCMFSQNFSGSRGGAIYCTSASNLQLTRSIFLDNEADPSG